MKNKILKKLSIALAAAMFCISCGQNQKEMEETEQMTETIILQPDEIEILCNMYVNEERIKSGNLFSYQQDNLERYRFAKQYLADKYPGYDLRIVSGEPKSKFTPYAKFALIESTDEEKTYKLYVKDAQDSEGYSAEDNFYGSFFAEQYDAYIQDILTKEIAHIAVVSSSMPWTEGKEYGSDMNMEDITGGKLELSANTLIFITDSAATETSAKETARSIEEIIQRYHLYGSFRVYIYEDGYPVEKLLGEVGIPADHRFKETFQNFRKESLWEDN